MTAEKTPTGLPTTVAYIGYHAIQRPDAIAVIHDGQAVTYADFYSDIGRLVAALRDQGLKPGNRAAVECPQFYWHWALLLAFETLGMATYSFTEDEAASRGDLLASMDIVMCFTAVPPAAKRVQLMDRDWFAAIRGRSPEHPLQAAPIGPETPLRIVQGSGTTGSVKWMIHTGRVREFRIDQYAFHTAFNPESRFLMVMNFGMQAFYAYLTACLRRGGICIHDHERGIAEALADYEITHVAMLPHMLVSVLDELPEGYVKPKQLHIFTSGGPVSPPLRDRVRKKLATELIESYGANEMGPVSITGEDGVGTVFPGIRVQAVDDNDRPVLGKPGRLRIKSEGNVEGYLGNPEATQHMFKGGWFYPGDLATVHDERRFEFLGRADDLLNIRGLQYPPYALEERLRSELPVSDICLTTLDDKDGVTRVWVVVVPMQKDQMPALQQQLMPLLPARFGAVKLIAVAQIPRTRNDKVQRNKLNEALGKFATA